MSRSSVTPETPYAGPPGWLAGVWLALALLFQMSLAHYVAFRGAVPSAVLVVVVWYAIRVDARRAAIYGLIAGLCEDVLSTGTGGAWTISTTLVAVGIAYASSNFFADSLIASAVGALLGTLVRDAIYWIVRAFEGFPAGLAHVHFHQTLWQALLNAVLMVVAMLLVRWRENYKTI